ncbi:hypothetical protein [Pandoraea bronchicola]|uniref:Uncharacterized protein n=1 Tax=Pandoraea bronchicola TaxID=2508287 RepID=A0A5E5BSK6_9BURK|nr:hypothetical protein [Pandoraea bronchicola]VVE88398.1 hypothetical protein PBR20603_02353 [Pandoraea bronchicola]
MIERQETNLKQAAALLHTLKTDPANVAVLLDLHRLLIRRITAAERATLRLKEIVARRKKSLSRDRLPKERAKAVKALINAAIERIDEHKNLMFLWRCFGDGIAHIYFDKYALKHTFYSVEDYSVKEDAGYLTGKDGFRLEWRMVRMAIAGGKPILLCDITHVLRHGDVCLMVGNDPFMIEVKSSRNRNERVDRQRRNLHALGKFFAEDGADEFRGSQNVRRVAHGGAEVTHTAALNAAIRRSYTEGTVVISPERGLYYVACSGDFDAEQLESVPVNTCMAFFLNQTKTERAWMPYCPFTLSINPEHVLSFIKGEISLVVLVDLKELQDQFLAHGLHATVINDGTWFLGLSRQRDAPDSEMSRLSEHLFLRIPLEFQSLSWFVNEQARIDREIVQKYLQLEPTPLDTNAVSTGAMSGTTPLRPQD